MSLSAGRLTSFHVYKGLLGVPWDACLDPDQRRYTTMNRDGESAASITGLRDGITLSVVVPSYNEEGNLEELYAELARIVPRLGVSWELIITDDGSADQTWERIIALHNQDEHVKGVRLSRNFGHQHALLAGLSQSTGNAVVMMDSDLQHPPEVIPELFQQWLAGFKIVHTIREDADDLPFFKKVTSRLYYRIFSILTGVKLESGMADFRLLDRQVVDDVLRFREDPLFLRGLVQWVGYPSSTIAFRSGERFSGTSKYTYGKMMRFARGGITSFSVIPLRITVIVGIVTALAAFAELFYVLYIRLVTDTAIPGWASAVGIISFLFGILFILMGVIGEYLGQILIEVRDRPRYLISEQVGIEEVVEDTV